MGSSSIATKLTIYEFAERLGISIGTVSRAFNNKSDVSAKTRKRVLEAAERLRFTPNQSGRNLSKGLTRTVAFMLEAGPDAVDLGEPFFLAVLAGLQEGLHAQGIDLSVLMGPPGRSQVERLRRLVEGRAADAVVLSETRLADPRIAYLLQARFPFATLGRSLTGGGQFASLDLDYAEAAEVAILRLADRGHSRIGVVAPTGGYSYAKQWVDGYRRAMRKLGLDVPAELIARKPPGEHGGSAATAQLLSLPSPPTAILFSNEYMTLGGYQALRANRIEIGGPFAVIVASDSPVLRTLQPAVTGFSAPTRLLGQRLAAILLRSTPAYAPGGKAETLREVLPLTLVPRYSDAGIP